MTDPLRAALEAARLHVADGHSCDDTRGDCSDHMERVYRAALAADTDRPETGPCWFCKGTFVVDALIAGYDTFDEQRLACLACNERMQGDWKSDTARPEHEWDLTIEALTDALTAALVAEIPDLDIEETEVVAAQAEAILDRLGAAALRAALAADAARPTYEATLVLELLDRAVLTTEDETEWREHSEGIRAAIQEGGLTLAIRRQLDFEATLDDNDGYGPFPASLAARLTEDRP